MTLCERNSGLETVLTSSPDLYTWTYVTEVEYQVEDAVCTKAVNHLRAIKAVADLGP